MSVNISVKNVPIALVAKLKSRAARHHRSMQGELIAMLDEMPSEPPNSSDIIRQLYAEVKAIGHPSPSESVRMIREDRDSEDR